MKSNNKHTNIINLVLAVFTVLSISFKSYGQANHLEDYTALRAFYLATDGDNWFKRTGWPSAADFQANPTPPAGTDMSTWWEVICEDNRVISLLLPANNLRGSLPDMKMSKLQQLWLDLNQLTGPIPILDMPDLEVLRAAANQLTGKLPNFTMPKLNQLILEHNMLSDTIPDFDMPKMRLLSLFNNRFSGKIPDFKMKDLELLGLGKNQLSGEIPKFTHLLNDSTIIIHLKENRLSGCFPQELKRFCAKATFESGDNPLLPWLGNFTQFCATDGSHDAQVGAPCDNGSADVIQDNCVCGILGDYCNDPDDYTALRALYLATDGDNWTDNTGWPTAAEFLVNPIPPIGTDMSQWFGIDCDGRVKQVNIENNNLIGSLPDMKLSELERFDLRNNQLSGPIPDLEMPILTFLSLSGNELSGSVPNFNMPLLEAMDFLVNKLTGSLPNFNMPELRELSFGSNMLSDTIPNFNMPKMTLLSLQTNRFTGKIPDFEMNDLEYLILSGNQLSGELPKFTHLLNDTTIVIRVNDNQLSGCFPPEFKRFCARAIFVSDYNPQLPWSGDFTQFCATDGSHDGQVGAPCNNGEINDEILDDCSCGQKVDNNGCNNIEDYVALRALYLATGGDNWTRRTNWPTAADFLANPTPLPGTDMSTWYGIFCEGRVTGIELEVNNLVGLLPDFKMSELRYINLDKNQLTSRIPDFNTPKLTLLRLANNDLTGPIPDFDLPLMEYIALHDNRLSGSIPNFRMKKLERLQLNDNTLTGFVPTFSHLENDTTAFIRLSNNLLSGCYPPELKRFCARATIMTQGNLLLPWRGDFTQFCATDGSPSAQVGAPCNNGKFDDEILDDCSCGQKVDDNGCNNIEDYTALRALYLATDGDNWSNRTNWPTAANFIANPTPPVGTDMNAWYGIFCIGRVVSVDLRDNNLEGTLPHMAMSSLTYLLLQENKLSGSIPNFDMPQLTTLRLGFNQLSGSIPDFDLPLLERLELNHNNLNGPIPLLGKTKLSDLILSENPLGDNIPDFDLPFLVQLLINDCQLIGSIPDFNLPELQILNLKNNRLTGTIPDFNLPKLFSLSLFKNELSGSLPPFSHIDATSSTSILISDNQLSGCFPAELKKFCDQGLFVSTGNDLLPWYGSFVQFCTTDGSHEAQVGASCYRNSVIDQILDDCSCGEVKDEECPEAKIIFPDFPNNQTTVCTNRQKINLAFEVTNDIPGVPAGVWWFMREDPEGTLIDISTMPATFDLVKAGVGTHTIILTYIQGDCRWSDSLQVSVIDGGLTVLEPDTIMIEKDLIATSYFLDNDILPHEPYTVSISSFPDEALNLLYFDEKGTLEVNAIKELTEDLTILYQVCDVCGDCYEGQILVLAPIDSGLTLTTLITPNAGSNNVLQFSQEPIPGAELWIFNRWGNRIYHQRNYQNDWNASGHSEGVYYYVLKVNGQTFRKTLTVVK